MAPLGWPVAALIIIVTPTTFASSRSTVTITRTPAEQSNRAMIWPARGKRRSSRSSERDRQDHLDLYEERRETRRNMSCHRDIVEAKSCPEEQSVGGNTRRTDLGFWENDDQRNGDHEKNELPHLLAGEIA